MAAAGAWRRFLQEAAKRRRERIYILPTRFGGLFLGGSAVMLLVGAAYSNNLVNLLACFLMSVLLVSMVQTHANLRDLRVAHANVEPGPAGGEVVATAFVENRGRGPKHSIEARARGLELIRADESEAPIPGRGSARLRASYRAGARGPRRLTRIQISTIYPLGLFRAWTMKDVEAAYWIYPRPEGPLPLPIGSIGDEASSEDAPSRLDASDFRGHRRSAPGDSHRRIDWKAFARGRPLLVKEFDGGGRAASRLDWADTASLGDVELRLSQLAKWVEQARAARVPFALILPSRSIGPSEGQEHAARCLEELARFAIDEESASRATGRRRGHWLRPLESLRASAEWPDFGAAAAPGADSDDRSRQIQGLLVAIVAFNVIPHAFTAPPWVVAIAASFLVWKALHLRRGTVLPSRTFRNALAGASAIGVFAQFRTVFGHEAASALLLILASLKTLDSNGYRDSMLVILTSFFLLMTHLLASQSLPSTAFMAIDVFLIATLMFHAHKRDRRGSARSFRPIMRILGYASPLWIFLFFAFPRFGAGLLPKAAAGAGKIGFSEELAPGLIARLVENDEPAFRVTFLQNGRGKRPPLEDMYWRGAVLRTSNGLAWSRGEVGRSRPQRPDAPDGPIAYEAILEPGFNRNLFTLESARTLEMEDASRRPQVRVGPGQVFFLDRPSDGRLLYRASADPLAPAEPESEDELRKWTEAPAGVSERVRAQAAALAAGATDDSEKAERTLQFFARGGFAYTRSPGAMKTGSLDEFLFDAKKGFCEHYAGAFATLMRLMNVPARVAVGFLGGKPNEFGSYVLVRGLDAHAWAEFYRRDLRRWERVDPTLAVAPMRSLLGGDFNSADPSWIASGLSPDAIRERVGWLRRGMQTASMAWDATTTAWSGFLLRYDFDYQLELLSRLGFVGASRLVFWIWALAGAIGFGAGAYAFLRWQAKREDPVIKAWRRFCARLAAAGAERAFNEGPIAYAERLERAARLPAAARADAARIARDFAQVRYGPAAKDGHRKRAFLKAARAFRAPRAGLRT